MSDDMQSRLDELGAMIEGSEQCARDAVMHLLALMILFFERKGLFARREFAEFLRVNALPRREDEDHAGQLLIDLRRWLDGDIQPHWPDCMTDSS